MPIQFNNIIIDDGVGQLEVVATLLVWDCKAKKVSINAPVVIRNAHLFANHSKLIFCIGEIDKYDRTVTYHDLNPFTASNIKFYLDLASGSRTHGRFTFDNQPIGKAYYGEDWKRIIYGSILHTGCKTLRYKTIKFVVTDDENRDNKGNFLDDPINNFHWKTGDSHAKASASLMNFLGLPLDALQGQEFESDYDPEIPIQFRVSERLKWVGKGTVAYNPDLDNSEFDLAIPLSSMKGNKLPLGNHEAKLLFGKVFESEERRAKINWMLLQWLSFETLEKDGVITKLEAKCQELRNAYNDAQSLAEILRIKQEEAEAELAESDEIQSEAEYVNLMIRIIRVDKQGILLYHPWILRRLRERLQAMWLNLAKTAGIRFFSVMTQPDESLAHYHVVAPDGRIIGGKVFCAPDFKEGKYIVFCNPMRHWGDMQIWWNQHEGPYRFSSGVMAAPTKLMLTLGRDFDGDFVQLIKADAYPEITKEIESFSDAPNVQKLPKVSLKGNLQQVAIRSMNDLTGVVASLLGRARAGNAENAVILIPPGGEQKEYQEMRIIDFLSQELQIAVDSIKSAYPNNQNGLRAVTEFLDEVEAEAPFIKDFKDPACYRDRVCNVDPDATDTVSRVVRIVNSYWRAPELQEAPSPRDYENVLFGTVGHAPEQLAYALKIREEYREKFRIAAEWRDANEGDSRMHREVSRYFQDMKPKILEATNQAGNTYSTESWVSAFWKAAHQANTGEAGMVFTIFGDEIVEKLMNTERVVVESFDVYGCQYGEWAAKKSGKLWRGQQVTIRVVERMINGANRMAIEMKWDGAVRQTGWHYLGLVGAKRIGNLTVGSTRDMLIYSTKWTKDDKTKAVILFAVGTREEDILPFVPNYDWDY